MDIIKNTAYYLGDGKIKNCTLTIKNIKSVDQFFKNRIEDAKNLASFKKNASIKTIQEHNSLYIEYENCGNIIDRLYLAVS